jgi:receptor-type tyrosine-protein phosphatase gamma
MFVLQFWPVESEPIESDYYRIKFVSQSDEYDYVIRNFVIQSIQGDYEFNVKLYHNPTWPNLHNARSIYDFVLKVHERNNESRNGPIVVVDR